MRNDLSSKFAPTPLHGAAYAVVIRSVGGINAIGACGDRATYAQMREKLDSIIAFARTLNNAEAMDAYEYGVAKVDADLQGRLEIMENNRRVTAALAALPQPEGL